MLKLATEQDYDELIRVGLLAARMYQPLNGEPDVQKVIRMINLSLQSPDEVSVIIMYMENDKAVGVIGVRADEALWHPGKYAQELFYYIDPEVKSIKVHNSLMEAYLYWAKKVGCTKVLMSCAEIDGVERISKVYSRKGFKPLERYFIKEL